MNTQQQQVNKVAEVINVLEAGKTFYQHLMGQVSEQDIQQVISKMFKEHEIAIRELQSFVMPSSAVLEEGESIAKTIVRTYAQLVDIISYESMHVFVDQLEELENKTLSLIDEAIMMPQPPIYKQYLQRVRVSVQECHDQIRLL